MNWSEKKIAGFTTIIIAIIIFSVSSTSFPASAHILSFKSILYHLSIFFFFAIFFLISVKKKFIPLVVLISLIYGILDEIHQIFVPGRNFSFLDIFWDSLGIIFAIMFYFVIRKSKILKIQEN